MWEQILATYNSIMSGPLLNLVIAVLIVLGGFIIGKILGRLVTKGLKEIELNEVLKTAGLKLELEAPIGAAVSYLIYFMAIIMALNQFAIVPIVLYIVVSGIIVLIILSTLLALKDSIPNLIAGFFLFRQKMVKKGDRIKIDNTVGKIIEISLLETKLETDEGDTVFIPNAMLTKKQVVKLH